MSLEELIQHGVWEQALPEAIGGAAVALIVLATDSVRSRRARGARIRKAGEAAATELASKRTAASLVADGRVPPDQVRQIPQGGLASLVQVGMERIGDAEVDVALARVSEELECFNGTALRLAVETTGVSRAMGDHDSRTAELYASAQSRAKAVVEALDELDTLLRPDV